MFETDPKAFISSQGMNFSVSLPDGKTAFISDIIETIPKDIWCLTLDSMVDSLLSANNLSVTRNQEPTWGILLNLLANANFCANANASGNANANANANTNVSGLGNPNIASTNRFRAINLSSAFLSSKVAKQMFADGLSEIRVKAIVASILSDSKSECFASDSAVLCRYDYRGQDVDLLLNLEGDSVNVVGTDFCIDDRLVK